MKAKILTITLGALGAAGCIISSSYNVSALSYQKNVDVGFKLEPSVSIKLSSSELTISDLAPGQSADSNIITLTVESNNANGYTVGSTVGGTKNETTYSNSNLQHSSNYDSTKSISYFQSLGTGDSIAELANLTTGTWGYTFSLDNGTTWINANKTEGVNNTGYSGLPFNNGETASAELVNVGTNAESSIQFKIAAAAQDQQYSGEYNNIVNFTTTVNMAPAVTYMQDVDTIKSKLANSGDTMTVVDSRDNTEYLVGKMADNNIWMLDNLALDLTDSDVKAAMHNETDTKTNATYTQLGYLFNGGGTSPATANGVKAKNKDGSGTWTNSYTDPYIATGYENDVVTSYNGENDPIRTQVEEGRWRVGIYYNYCAASAGTYCYPTSNAPSDDQNGIRSIDADICPSGWRMPTSNTSGEFYSLATAITGTAGTQTNDNYTSFRTAFRLPMSGYFYSSAASSQGGYGSFWSSTRKSSAYMYRLTVNTSTVSPANNADRNRGASLRCVLSSN